MSRVIETILICLCMLWASIALAEDDMPRIHFDETHSENLPFESCIFNAEEGENMARSARVESGKRARTEAMKNTEYCFHEMKEAAEDGECSISFFAEDASCNTESLVSGCFENRFFKHKLEHLGFKIRRQEMPTDDTEDHCAAITVAWCRDLKKGHRHD